ncbi:DUF5993 family protein [Acuticoccus sp. M5D2P5]|uniref:DUF5993 family protein n=1 Tax=Acuticoccus kalidii TaxID=2910977 RepID=UPI001F339800|nr:DUF5993 family protein [Acuticoccus kalidii]MCF3934735.1 DUF5993 family protein [Acuticoccus kalidii]
MMSIPFFTSALAVVLAWCGLRVGAIAMTLISVVVLLVLFRFHATDALDIAL